MSIEGFCVKCRKNQIMQNIKFTKTSRGVDMAKGKCSVCNTNMARIGVKPQNLPEGVTVHKTAQNSYINKPGIEVLPQPIPNYPQNQDLTEINKQIANLQQQKTEKERVLKYIEEAKRNPVLNSHGIGIFDQNEGKVVKRSIYTLLKVLLVLFGVAIIVLFFMGYKGYFKSSSNCSPTNVCQECPIIPSCPNMSCPGCPQSICNVNQSCIFPNEINVNLNSS